MYCFEVFRRGAPARPPSAGNYHRGAKNDLVIRFLRQQEKRCSRRHLEDRLMLGSVQYALWSRPTQTSNPGQCSEQRDLVSRHRFDRGIYLLSGSCDADGMEFAELIHRHELVELVVRCTDARVPGRKKPANDGDGESKRQYRSRSPSRSNPEPGRGLEQRDCANNRRHQAEIDDGYAKHVPNRNARRVPQSSQAAPLIAHPGMSGFPRVHFPAPTTGQSHSPLT